MCLGVSVSRCVGFSWRSDCEHGVNRYHALDGSREDHEDGLATKLTKNF
jgi:hypothetical protein